MPRIFIPPGWPRLALRLHLSLLPSRASTGFMLARFSALSRGLEGAERSAARRRFIKRRRLGAGSVIRLAFQEVLERRGWALGLGAIGFFGLVGVFIGRIARAILGGEA